MVVFDVDGTLIGGEPTDWASFNAAFLEVAGIPLNREFLMSLEEVTAQSVVHGALAGQPLEERKAKEAAISRRYLALLKAAFKADPGAFPATEGAAELLLDLKARGIPVAIATGDWRSSILFKLEAAGIPFAGIPIMTASDHYSRADIIAGAVAAAGGTIRTALYVGDGLWDYRACKKLGIPFIGIGHRAELLRGEGATHLLSSLMPEEFWRVRNAMGLPPWAH